MSTCDQQVIYTVVWWKRAHRPYPCILTYIHTVICLFRCKIIFVCKTCMKVSYMKIFASSHSHKYFLHENFFQEACAYEIYILLKIMK